MPIIFRERPRVYRDTKTSDERRFYGSAEWKAIRLAHLEAEPFCRLCLASDRTVAGRVVDHIVPIRAGGDPLDDSNLQTLCDPCHNAKRFRERGRAPRGRV